MLTGPRQDSSFPKAPSETQSTSIQRARPSSKDKALEASEEKGTLMNKRRALKVEAMVVEEGADPKSKKDNTGNHPRRRDTPLSCIGTKMGLLTKDSSVPTMWTERLPGS